MANRTFQSYGSIENASNNLPVLKQRKGTRAAIFSALGIVASVAMIVHLSAAPKEYMLEDYPTRPPVMDHTAFGVGNEDAIEGVANWALRVIGKTNGTMIEAMLKNGSVSSMFAPLTVERIKEVHQAQREQSPLGLEEAVAPFPHEDEIMGESAATPSAAAPAAEEPPAP